MKVAIIPARGGSKRIPRKNIRPFAGRPVLAWSIDAARKAGLFDHVVVSTDDEEISAVAQHYGAETPFVRPDELADDYTSTNAVVRHAIRWFIDHGSSVSHACCIYATAPFVQARLLQDAFKRLVDSGKSFAFSVTSFPFPIQRAIRINRQGLVEAIWPENIPVRSQDLEETFHDAGQFYWGTAEAFLENRVLFSSESIPIVLPRYLVQDIDTPEDWKRAEYLFSAVMRTGELVV